MFFGGYKMPGNAEVIASLNGLLADELAAINQYTAHYLALENWGFDGLAVAVKDRAEDEQKHARKIAARILELGGAPIFGAIGTVTVSLDAVPPQLAADADAEDLAIAKQNAAIKVSFDAGDNTTAHLVTLIVTEESEHLSEIQGWQAQIAQMSLAGFLTAHVEE
jgi:bacterioferritin